MKPNQSLVIVETHPIQYHAPIYRVLQQRFDIPVTAIYGSDFSIAGYRDAEFGSSFAWDTDLTSGYTSVFLSRVANGGAQSAEEVTTRGLADVLRRIAPLAILLVGYSPRFHQQAFWCAWRTGSPLLFRGETTDHAKDRRIGKRWVRDILLRSFYRRYAGLLYVGQRSRAHYRRLGCNDARLFFSPYCVDTSAFQPEEPDRERLRTQARHNLGFSGEQLVILFSGKLVSRKAPDLLVQAVKLLRSDVRKRIVLLFLGDGNMRELLQHSAQEPPSVETRFAGFQNQRSLSSYYHAADLMVLPSHEHETWGLVVNEALHHGVPCVVSTNVGSAPDLIEPGVTGEVFESGDAQSLVLALERAIGLTGRADVRGRCRDKVSGYTVEQAARGIARAYRSVTRSNAARGNNE